MPSEVEGRRNETPESSPEGPAPQQQCTVVCDEPHCPQCGGPLRWGWGSVCLCAFMIFLVSAPTMMVGLAMRSQAGVIVFLILAGLAILSLVAVPFTGALAVASRSCCSRQCRMARADCARPRSSRARV
jgi:hypothetical protein